MALKFYQWHSTENKLRIITKAYLYAHQFGIPGYEIWCFRISESRIKGGPNSGKLVSDLWIQTDSPINPNAHQQEVYEKARNHALDYCDDFFIRVPHLSTEWVSKGVFLADVVDREEDKLWFEETKPEIIKF